MNDLLINKIDALLPQTQCGQCGYKGCLPYAKAIATQEEAINRCPPGGVKTLLALGALLQQDVKPLMTQMRMQEKVPQLAKIQENECIGCTKCIKACPVDAIVGAAKQLHFILENECTGCGLCVEPCPVDCITLFPIKHLPYNPQQAKQRFYAKQQRLQEQAQQSSELGTKIQAVDSELEDKKAYIQAAILRAKLKKSIS